MDPIAELRESFSSHDHVTSNFEENFDVILSFREKWKDKNKLGTINAKDKEKSFEMRSSEFWSYGHNIPDNGIIYRIISKSVNGYYRYAVPLTTSFGAEPYRHLRHIAVSSQSSDNKLQYGEKHFTSYKELEPGDCISVTEMCQWDGTPRWDGDEHANFRVICPPMLARSYSLLRFRVNHKTKIPAVAFKHASKLFVIVAQYHRYGADYSQISLPRHHQLKTTTKSVQKNANIDSDPGRQIRCNELPFLWKNAEKSAETVVYMKENSFCVFDVDIQVPIPGCQRYPLGYSNDMSNEMDQKFMMLDMESVPKMANVEQFPPIIVKIHDNATTDEEIMRKMRVHNHRIYERVEMLEVVNCAMEISQFIADKKHIGYNTNTMCGFASNINADETQVTFDLLLNFSGYAFPAEARLVIFVGMEKRSMPAQTLNCELKNKKAHLKMCARFSQNSLQDHRYQELEDGKNIDRHNEAVLPSMSVTEFAEFLRSKNSTGSYVFCRQDSIGNLYQAKSMMARAWNHGPENRRLDLKPSVKELVDFCSPTVDSSPREYVVERAGDVVKHWRLFNIAPNGDQWRTLHAAIHADGVVIIDAPAGAGKTTSIAQTLILKASTQSKNEVCVAITSSNATTKNIIDQIELVQNPNISSHVRPLRLTTTDAADKSDVTTPFDSMNIFEAEIHRVVDLVLKDEFVNIDGVRGIQYLLLAFGYANQVMKLNVGPLPSKYGNQVGTSTFRGKYLPKGEKPADVFNKLGIYFYKPNVIVATATMMSSIPLQPEVTVSTVLFDGVSAESPWSIFMMLVPFCGPYLKRALLFGDSAQSSPFCGRKAFQKVSPNGCDFLKKGALLITYEITMRLQPQVMIMMNKLFYSLYKDKMILDSRAGGARLISDSLVNLSPTFTTLYPVRSFARNDEPCENHAEAKEAVNFIVRVLTNNTNIVAGEILLTSFYKKQKQLLKHYAQEAGLSGVRIGTTREYMGQNAELAVFSLARFDPDEMSESPRMCLVALSRSKGHTVVFTNHNMLAKSVMWKSVKEANVPVI